MKSLVSSNLTQPLEHFNKDRWSLLFRITATTIWELRNRFIFQRDSSSICDIAWKIHLKAEEACSMFYDNNKVIPKIIGADPHL
ncbi:Signal transduction histidine kinase, partial [Sesbania bispinosa]